MFRLLRNLFRKNTKTQSEQELKSSQNNKQYKEMIEEINQFKRDGRGQL